MPRRTRKPINSAVWECAMCSEQMFGGARCFEHNPTPDQRAETPERYQRMTFAPSVHARKQES